MMTVHGQISEKDFISSQFLYMRPRPIFSASVIIVLSLIVWAIWPKGTFVFLGCLVALILWFVYIPFQSKRTYRQYKAMSEPVEMQVRDDGLFFRRENGEGLVPWSHIIKWRYNRKLILLYPTSNLFYMVPLSFFNSLGDYQAFQQVLKERIGNAV